VSADEASPALLDLRAAVDAAVRDDGLVLSPNRMVCDLEILVESSTKLDAKLVRALRTALVNDATTKIFGQSVKAWLVQERGMSPARAGRFLFLVRFLDSFPLTEAAFDAGNIHVDHAGVVLRALLTLPWKLRETVEPMLLNACREMPPSDVAKWVDQLLEAMGYDKESDERRERRFAQRGVETHATAYGVHGLSGSLMPEVAEAFKLALQTAGGKCGEEDNRSPRQRMHDALGVVCTFFNQHADQPMINGERPRVVVTIRWEDLQKAIGVGALATLGSGAKIPVETARRVCCDAGVLPVVLGGNGEVLDMGRERRDFSLAIRKAAWIQQGGRCAFPKCSRRIVECHHIVWWSLHGRTSLDNAAWLCSYHHWLVHEGKWTMRKDATGFTFESPYGAERHRCFEAA
jgi:hypothetical protein